MLYRKRKIFSSATHHPALARSGLTLNRPIRPRISRKSVLGTTTSAIRNTTYRQWLTTLAPMLAELAVSGLEIDPHTVLL